jgi:hypothetical protein
VYLNGERLNDALLPFLANALFDPKRTGYRRTCLEAEAGPACAAPAKESAEEGDVLRFL